MQKLLDFLWTFIYPSICFCSIIIAVINIKVLSQIKRIESVYNYMYLKSISNFFYLLISFFVFMFKCGYYCDFENSYLVKIYELYFFINFENFLGLLEILIEITISLNRFFCIINKQYFKILNSSVIVFLLAILSLLLSLPNIFMFEVVHINIGLNASELIKIPYSEIMDEYKIRTKFSSHLKYFELSNLALRGILIILILVILNFLCLVKYKNSVGDIIGMENLNNNSLTSN
jgi:hypothetical protein